MAVTQTPGHEASTIHSDTKHSNESRPNVVRRAATDDEILGLTPAVTPSAARNSASAEQDRIKGRQNDTTDRPDQDTAKNTNAGIADAEPENLRTAFDANPELRQAWHDAQAYREAFPTPEEARAATGLLADLNRMDALFFSQRPEDHAALARAVAEIDPAAFASLARAMNTLAADSQGLGENPARAQDAKQGRGDAENARQTRAPSNRTSPNADAGNGNADVTAAQEEFFHATNAAAVQSVLDAIESQVERLLPEGASKSARNRVVGEIYRELDNTLRSNRQLVQQMREALRSGALDGEHQRAIVSLIAGRARQALPGVAKRVLNEWTSTVVAANQDRRARQRAAERRVDIAGSNGGVNDGRRPTTPSDIDYARMSDADILNL
jgi:hypothetical protein